jgi:hypothetical protein
MRRTIGTALSLLAITALLGAAQAQTPAQPQTTQTQKPTPAPGPLTPDDPRLKTDQMLYEYATPTNPAQLPLYETMKKTQILEKLKDFLAPVRLPRQILIKMETCGVANAYYDPGIIKVCYEYIEYVKKMTPKVVRHGLTPNDQLIGPIADVFLHEFGHAIVRELEIPFFAKEEDTADYIATYILLMFPDDDARRLLLGTAFLAGAEAREEQAKTGALTALADSHSLPAQRFFNKWCMAYGSDKELFADAPQLGMIPANRLKWCRWEWVTNEDSFKRLIMPFIDRDLLKKNKDRQWFKFQASAADTMSGPKTAAPAPGAAPAQVPSAAKK